MITMRLPVLLTKNPLFLIVILFLLAIPSAACANEVDERYRDTIQHLEEQGYAGIDQAIVTFDDIVAGSPEYWKAHLGLANAYLLKYEFSEHKKNEWLEQALVHLDVLIKNRQLLLEAYFRRGLVRLNLNQITEAKTDLQQALEIKPAYLEAHLIFLQLLLSHNEPAQAREKAAAWITNYPAASPAAQKFGDLFYAAEDYETAVRYYDKALQQHPKESALLMSLGRCYQKLGQDDKGSDVFKKVLLLTPDNHEARFLYGVSLSNRDMLEAAIEQFERYRKDFPKEISALNNLAVLYEKTGNLLKAKLMWLKVKELSSDPKHKQRAESNLLRLFQSAETDRKQERD
jgi:tetratricopeptide (TPR) repeat protein